MPSTDTQSQPESKQKSGHSWEVTVAGSKPTPVLFHGMVEDNLRLPDMAVLTFFDPAYSLGTTALGAPVVVKAIDSSNAAGEELFDGQVTAVEGLLEAGKSYVVIRALDKSHRLYRGRFTKAYQDVKYSDVVSQIASRNGLSADASDPNGAPSHKHVLQNNISDAEMLSAMAAEYGYVWQVTGTSLKFKPPTPASEAPSGGTFTSVEPLKLVAGSDLLRYNSVLTADSQVKEVQVRSWDPWNKTALVGTAAGDETFAQIGTKTAASTIRDFGSPKFLANDIPFATDSECTNAAKSIAAQIASTHAQIEGLARGNAKLRAGKAISVGPDNNPLGGKFTLTFTRHEWINGEYFVHFSSSGLHERSLQALTAGGGGGGGGVASAASVTAPIDGIVIAEVTNINDPDSRHRVKVKYHWLGENVESDWLRVIQIGAGKDRGFHWMPDMNDEVAVVFDHGDMRSGYVIGGVYNATDTPKYPGVVSGVNEVKSLVSSKGHYFKLSDKGGEEFASLSLVGDKMFIKLDKDGQMIKVDSDGKVEIHGVQDITVKGDAKVAIEAAQDLELKGMNVKITAQTGFEAKGATVKVEGTGQTEIKGAQTKVAGSAMLDLEGGAMANLKAGIVKIN